MSFLNLILMIPALPAASYLEEGLVMSSIFQWKMPEHFKILHEVSTRQRTGFAIYHDDYTLFSPKPDATVFVDYDTGDRSNKLSTWLPAEDILFSTLMMMRSSFLSIRGTLAVTSTSDNV
ncbi:MAG: hypothetical protein IPO69_23115 [Saprospiraceae bacterium]|nr:hypothetical protein [Saprospiraceae bacterium]